MDVLVGSSEGIDITVVEDDADQRRLVVRVLENAGFTVSSAGSMRGALEVVPKDHPRILLCDVELPDGNGVQPLCKLREDPESVGMYCILQSAAPSGELAAGALTAGADDYLVKPLVRQELVARVRIGLRMWTMYEQLRKAATTDGLTGLYNHDYFYRTLETEMGRSRRYGHPLALIMLDLDFFKAVNDSFGHQVGNDVLKEVARVLSEGVRDIDTVARVGGEEFAILLPEALTADAAQVAERIRIALPKSASGWSGHAQEVTASFGVADSEDPRVNCTADLLDLADRALYQAKRQGRNRVCLAGNLSERGKTDVTIETDEVEWLRRRLAVLSARVRDVYVQSVTTLLKALDEKDPYAARHCVNVAFYAEQIAEQMGCSRATGKSVYNASLLHDIGKVGIPDTVLMKRTTLTPLEQMVMDQAPLIGTRIVDHMRILEAEIQIIRHQHEYFDGSGGPSGLKGDQIPIGSRILFVCDAFDAMTTDRVYRARRPADEVIAEILRLGGTQFDPVATKALRSVFHAHRIIWQQRIDDTIRATRVPGDEGIGLAARGFAPGSV